jgi:hypothetical protein
MTHVEFDINWIEILTTLIWFLLGALIGAACITANFRSNQSHKPHKAITKPTNEACKNALEFIKSKPEVFTKLKNNKN